MCHIPSFSRPENWDVEWWITCQLCVFLGLSSVVLREVEVKRIFPEYLFSDMKRDGCLKYLRPLLGAHPCGMSALGGKASAQPLAQWGLVGTFGGCPRVSGGYGVRRLEEVVTFISQVSPDFQGEAQVFRAELDMGPKSKQECTERDAGACSQSWRTEEAAWCLAWLSQLKSKLVSYRSNLAPYPNTPPPLPASI